MGQLLGSKYHYEINKNMKNYINCCGEERGSDLMTREQAIVFAQIGRIVTPIRK